MKVTIYPIKLGGTIRAIASKSQAHRLLISAALADRPTDIICRESSRDIDATAACLRALGCGIMYDEEQGRFRVEPLRSVAEEAVIDCGESGSTLRFLLPVVCALGVRCRIVMHGRLSERPLSPLWEELEAHGAILRRNEDSTISTSGRLSGGVYTLAANISSQFISGMLFAMPLIDGESKLRLTGKTESESYILMTMAALKRFGIDVLREGNTLRLSGTTGYVSPRRVEVEGDWSNAAFWLCASALSGGAVTVTGLDMDSVQGDKAAAGLIGLIQGGSQVVDAGNIPDLVPVLSALASASPGETRFINAGRLRIKESDRIRTTVEMLKGLGANAFETADGLIVSGRESLDGGIVDSHNDHRIAMSAAVASIACRKPVVINGAEAVAKSYPRFWRDFAALGGRIRIEE